MQARIHDERMPLSLGLLGQETTGAGGFCKAMRTIPAALNLAGRWKRAAPTRG
jgi:6-phospho-beta-glucosidase